MKTIFLLYALFLSIYNFSQKELVVDLEKKSTFDRIYLASDGSSAVLSSIGSGDVLTTFGVSGNLSSRKQLNTWISDKAYFNAKEKYIVCLRAELAKKMEIHHVDFEGNTYMTSIKRNPKELSTHIYTRLNEDDLVEFYFEVQVPKNIIYRVLTYNPGNKTYTVRDIAKLKGVYRDYRFLGVNATGFFILKVSLAGLSKTKDSKFTVLCVDNENVNVKEVHSLEIKNNGLNYITTEVIPVYDEISTTNVAFYIERVDFENEAQRREHMLVGQKDKKISYLICKLNTANNSFFQALLNPRQIHLNGRICSFLGDDEGGKTSLLLVNDSSEYCVFQTDFDSDLASPSVYPRHPIKRLALLEDKYPKLYKATQECTAGSFRICDDGIARVLFIGTDKRIFLMKE